MAYRWIFLFILISTIGFGQKPKSIESFEISAPPADEVIFNGNNRINARTGYPVGMFHLKENTSGFSAEERAISYISNNAEQFGLNKLSISDDLKVGFVRHGLSGDVIHLYQFYKGIRVHQSEITIHINKNNFVTLVNSNLKYGLDHMSVESLVSQNSALTLAIDRIKPSENPDIIANDLVILSKNGDHYLAWCVVFHSSSPLGDWETFVEAKTGDILQLTDVARYHPTRGSTNNGIKKLAWHPPMSVAVLLANGTGNVFDPDPLSSAGVAYGSTGFTDAGDVASAQLNGELMSRTLNDITQTGATFSLVGPWAEIREIEAPTKGLFSQNSSTFNFNRSDDGFEAVNVYYHIDASMRYINLTLGLNIKPSTYTGGVRFDPHGANGADQSYYSGGSNEHLVFGEGGVDDSEDSDVIHHELGHGLHDWVTGGSLSQVNGLSEGSGDYWAASYNRSLGNWTPADPAYYYVFNWDGHNEFWPGRTANYRPGSPPYPGSLVGQVHTDGQIWSTCMMDVYDLISKQKCDVIFWDGLGMTNSSSNQDDAANAVYQTAIDLNYTSAELIYIHTALTNCGYTLPGIIAQPQAGFASSSQLICLDLSSQVSFSDTTFGSPNTWSWIFEGGTPSSSTVQNPQITYSSTGTFDVSLVVSNSIGSDTVTIVDYITVQSTGCGSCFILASTDIPQTISDVAVNPVVSVITVTSSNVINDVNILGLQGTHTWLGDLDFVLVSPMSTQVMVISRQCSSNNDFDLDLDDESIINSFPCPYNTGESITPSNPLSAFIGEVPQGDWELRITDNAPVDNGLLQAWSLEICTNAPSLPVELVAFSINNWLTEFELMWNTASEVDNYGFDIERSMPESLTFEKIGFIAGKNNSTSVTHYKYLDRDLSINGRYAYRLKQIDNSGSFTYSNIEYADYKGETSGISLYPNPASSHLNILGDYKLIESITIVDAKGQQILTIQNVSKSKIDVEFLDSGIYYFEIQLTSGYRDTRMIYLE